MTIAAKTTVLAVLVMAVFIGGLGLAPPVTTVASEGGEERSEKGASMIKLKSGRLSSVDFPHRQHQSWVADCNTCHRMFPRKRGAIRSMQEKGELEKQAVMNENCIACHKETKKDGSRSGPLSCTGCHPR